MSVSFERLSGVAEEDKTEISITTTVLGKRSASGPQAEIDDHGVRACVMKLRQAPATFASQNYWRPTTTARVYGVALSYHEFQNRRRSVGASKALPRRSTS